ncbi:MAG: isopentenyl-diphosphate Delta-isomerase [Bacteroidota bacterium]
MMNEEYVVLVDENNNEIGIMEKQEAHQKALLHRAFSIFIFNSEGELMLQQRALTKYHSGGLWTNTCCSHPRAGETTVSAAHRRLSEEMGFDCELTERFSFIYQTPFDNGLSEHELDFVYTGIFDDLPHIHPSEVAAYRWITLDNLIKEVHEHPEHFTSWFQIILKEYLEHL